MPSRPGALVTAFQIQDPNNEVVCPLRNQDGSSCRKRCIGEKRFRSMQEHIRRAHPENYIPKLPATEESFHMMINNPSATDRATPIQTPGQNSQSTSGLSQGGSLFPAVSVDNTQGYLHDPHAQSCDPSSAPGTPKAHDEYAAFRATPGLGPTSGSILPNENANAAAALAQLSNNRSKRDNMDWESEGWHSDTDSRRIPRSNIELPSFQQVKSEITSEPFPSLNPNRGQLAAILSTSPPGRSSTLPPIQRLGPSRPRKQSVSKRSIHRKRNSRGTTAEWMRRITNEERLRPPNQDRKAMSVEPEYAERRWADLLDAANSANEEADEERTPVPQSPVPVQRASLPPIGHPQHFQQQHGQNYQASPLNNTLTPPQFLHDGNPEPFPSVESGESGENFHMNSQALVANSSPSYSSPNIQIYCAMCHNLALLRESLACTECICGICQQCVSVLMEEQGARRKCPHCKTIGGRFKPFQLDIRC